MKHFCLACLKNGFGERGGNLEEDSQTDSGTVGSGSQKEFLEKSLFVPRWCCGAAERTRR